jgi:hypothetical protein
MTRPYSHIATEEAHMVPLGRNLYGRGVRATVSNT